MCDRVQSRAAGYRYRERRQLHDIIDALDALQSLDAGQSADTLTYGSSAGSGADDGAPGKAADAAGQTTAT